MELKDRILSISRDHFFKFGIRNVTMKDIADSLGVSKKTLYAEFENKDAIVTEITETYLCDHAKRCIEIIGNSENAIDEIIAMMSYVQKTMKQLNANMMMDLKKYHPKGWHAMEQHKTEHIEKLLSANIERGKKEGLYRLEINNQIITRLKTYHLDMISDISVFPGMDLSYADLHRELTAHYLYGLCTCKGHALLEEKINELK